MPGAGRFERAGELAVGAENLHAVVARVGDDESVARRGIVDGTRAAGSELPLAVPGRPERKGELYGMPTHARLSVVEDLHAVVARVGDGDAVAVPGKGDGSRRVKLPVAVAGRAEREGERAVDVEYLHAIVARVGDGDHAVVGNGNAFRRREVAGAGAGHAEHECGHAVGMKHLHAVVARVGDGDHAAVRDEGDALRRRELPGSRAGRPERVGRRAVRMEYPHAVVARVGDGDHAAVAYGDALRRREMPGARAGRPERVGRRAVCVEHPHAVAVSVDGYCHAGPQGRRRGAAVGMRGAGGGGQQARGGDGREWQERSVTHDPDARKPPVDKSAGLAPVKLRVNWPGAAAGDPGLPPGPRGAIPCG